MLSSQRGIALVMALMIILFSALLTLVLGGIAVTSIKLNSNLMDYKKAVYAAEAGQEYARAVISNSDYKLLENENHVDLLNGSSFSVQIMTYNVESNICVIVSRGRYFDNISVFKTEINVN